MTETGLGIENDGTPQYAYRLSCAARNSVWLVAIGFLWLFDVVGVLPWGRSWPLLLIIGGVLLFIRRALPPVSPYAGPYPEPDPPYGPPPPPPPAVASTAIVPVSEAPTHGPEEVR
jgi:hypothetical protein